MLSPIASFAASGAALACPVCPSGATALLASFGAAGFASAGVLKPILVGFLAASIVALALGYRRHRTLWPLLLAVPGAAALYVARWHVASAPLLYGGIALLIIASALDALAQRRLCRCCEQA